METINVILFVILPYLAIASLIFVTIYRFKTKPFSFSALSSQFLERKKVFWGSLPWHIGIGVVLSGHAIALLLPGLQKVLVSNLSVLYVMEVIGLSFAILCFIGLLVLFIRRIGSSRLLQVSTPMDTILLLLLLMQILLGIATAVQNQWGAAWSVGTASPYFLSIIFLHPEVGYIEAMGWIFKLHVVGAWLLVLLVPFSRLVHIFSLPITWFTRENQVVRWVSSRSLFNMKRY